jgi:hypothetical protein
VSALFTNPIVFELLSKIAMNENGEYSQKIQFNAAVQLIELTHKNIELKFP